MSGIEPYDTGEETQVKQKKTKAQLNRERELEALRNILSTYDGRAFLWRLLEECGIYTSSFTGNSTTFFNEGKRHVGLWTLNEIMDVNPNSYQQMRVEAVERNKR